MAHKTGGTVCNLAYTRVYLERYKNFKIILHQFRQAEQCVFNSINKFNIGVRLTWTVYGVLSQFIRVRITQHAFTVQYSTSAVQIGDILCM
jgi:hypothetical protein